MSRFYQRYLVHLKAEEKRDGVISSIPSSASSVPARVLQIDPTSQVRSSIMIPLAQAAETSESAAAAEGGGGAAGGAAGGGGGEEGATTKARRVQIFNSSDEYTPDGDVEPEAFVKPAATKSFLRDALKAHYLFESLADEDLGMIVDCMKPFPVSAGGRVINQGDLGDQFFCLQTGTAVANVEGQGSVMTYEPGGCFGELALIYNTPRMASVVAVSDCQLWALDLRTFRHILANTSSAKMVKRCEFLKKCAFLDSLSNEQISKLAGALDSSSYEDGEFIVRQGGAGTEFYIIEEGSIRCTQVKSSGREVELITLQAGDYFGEMALMLNELRAANCISVGKVKCLSLDRAKFDMLLGPVQEVLSKRMRVRILQSVPLLAKLSEAKLNKLTQVMKTSSFKDGEYIIRQGEEGSRFYIINEGEVKCTRSIGAAGGQEEELIRLNAQEFFGERALITNEVRKANVVACGPCECLVLERTSFQSLLSEVQEDITQVMARRESDRPDSAPPAAGGGGGAGGAKAAAPVVPEVPPGPSTSYRYDELRVMRTIGTGTFGRVKMVQHVSSGNVYALKYMNKAEIVANHQDKNVASEKNLLYDCSQCVFVLKLMQTYNTPNQIMMLMEFIQGGELWSYIYEKKKCVPRNSFGGFEISAVKFYAANVILAFQHMHGKGIAYRDLKPENILIDQLGYVKIIDFGFAKKLPMVKNGVRQDKTFTLCGTPEYLAPEIVMSKGYDKSVDYWALGCLIYELLLGRTPFQADFTNKIFQNIVSSDKVLAFPPKSDPAHTKLCKALLSPNPAFRLGNMSGGVADIMKDKFLSSVNWAAIASRTFNSPYSPVIKNASDASNFERYEEDSNIPVYAGSQSLFEGF